MTTFNPRRNINLMPKKEREPDPIVQLIACRKLITFHLKRENEFLRKQVEIQDEIIRLYRSLSRMRGNANDH